MAITKFTITKTNIISKETFNPEDVKKLIKTAEETAKVYERAAGLFSYLMQYPDHDIRQAYGVFFGPNQVSINKYANGKTIYNWLGVCVTTEQI